MNNDELIYSLKMFQKERIENLDITSRDLFDAIMRIVDERDKYKNIIERIKYWLELELKGEVKTEYAVPFRIALDKICELETGDNNE